MSVTTASDEPKLDVGWVVRSTANILRRRAADLLVVAVPFVWLPNILIAFLPDQLNRLQILAGIPGLVFVGGGSLLAYRELTGGERLTGAGAISAGAARFGTMWAIAFISGLATLVGLLLLIVPGVIATVGFMSASTAAMAEGRGSSAALERAWSLGRGSRWRLTALLGLGLLCLVGLLVITMVVGIIMGLVGATDTIEPIVSYAISPIVGVVFTAITTVGSAAAYVNIRTAKEGPSADVANIFT
ncbi:MAG: hypothetical protein WDM85_11080 [Caulobacteraceae bacterium]